MRPTRTRAIVAIGAALGSAPLALGCSRAGERGERPNDEAPSDGAADPVTGDRPSGDLGDAGALALATGGVASNGVASTGVVTGGVGAQAADAGAAGADAAPGSAERLPSCGHENEPDCPLQAWMKAKANDAVRSNDPDQLAAAFDAMVRFAPPDRYPNWISIAQDGARVARQGDPEAARAACRSCHVQYEVPYRAELRARAM